MSRRGRIKTQILLLNQQLRRANEERNRALVRSIQARLSDLYDQLRALDFEENDEVKREDEPQNRMEGAGKRPLSKWQLHIKKTAKKHPSLKGPALFKKAGSTYKK